MSGDRKQGSRTTRISIYVALAVMLVLAVVYFLIDPMQSRFAPKCIFLQLTGWECAGCGSQRMFHALLHLRFADAFAANPFLFCMIPVIIFLIWLEASRRRFPRLYARVFSPAFPIVAGALIILWTVVRNLI